MRRGDGEGSIRRRTPDLFEARYVDADHRRRSIYGPTRKDVASKLAAALRDRQLGVIAPSDRQTVAVFLDRWLADVAVGRLRPRTIERYTGLVRQHIAPAIGDVPIARLTPQHLVKLYAAKRADLGPSSIRYLHAVLHAALGQAVRWHLIARNPADAVAPPRPVDRQPMRYLEPDQVRQLLDAAEGDPLHALYVTAVYTGLRLGELLGLAWSSIDLDAGVLTVRVGLSRTGGSWTLAEPKTSSSRRQVRLAAPAIAALRAHRIRQLEARLRAGEAWTEHGLVFVDAWGEPIIGAHVTERSLKPLLRAAGLPLIRFHDLRHTFASLMLSGGARVDLVSSMLGHSSPSMTLSVYAHLMPGDQDRAIARLEELLR